MTYFKYVLSFIIPVKFSARNIEDGMEHAEKWWQWDSHIFWRRTYDGIARPH